jgi:hypothetical protein
MFRGRRGLRNYNEQVAKYFSGQEAQHESCLGASPSARCKELPPKTTDKISRGQFRCVLDPCEPPSACTPRSRPRAEEQTRCSSKPKVRSGNDRQHSRRLQPHGGTVPYGAKVPGVDHARAPIGRGGRDCGKPPRGHIGRHREVGARGSVVDACALVDGVSRPATAISLPGSAPAPVHRLAGYDSCLAARLSDVD